MRSQGSWRRNSMQLDKIAASRMHLDPHIALSNLPCGLYRMVLECSGIDLASNSAKILLKSLDDIGAQEMLRNQPISIRYSAAQNQQKKRRIHGASKIKD